MRLIRNRGILEYGMFAAALIPTMLVLLAAMTCLTDNEGASAPTTQALLIYRAS